MHTGNRRHDRAALRPTTNGNEKRFIAITAVIMSMNAQKITAGRSATRLEEFVGDQTTGESADDPEDAQQQVPSLPG